MFGEVTNNDRAKWASSALSAFAVECYAPGAEDDETILGDLLCNFRHLADAQGWDIESIWERTRGMHEIEVAEDGGKADPSFAEGRDKAAATARIAEIEAERDSWVIGAPNGTETPGPEGWARDNPEDAAELERLYSEAAK